MVWGTGLLIFLLGCAYIQPGAPALSKAGLQQTKVMMKNLCKRSSGVSQDSLNQLQAKVFINDRKLKCYIHCCLGMMKTMRKDKITVAEATKQIESLLPEEMREPSLKQLNTCKDAGEPSLGVSKKKSIGDYEGEFKEVYRRARTKRKEKIYVLKKKLFK